MNLTGKQLVEQGIITGSIAEENVQMHGCDLNIAAISRVDGTNETGLVPVEGKTKLAQRIGLDVRMDNGRPPYWYLEPGAYDITCVQGCKVPAGRLPDTPTASSRRPARR